MLEFSTLAQEIKVNMIRANVQFQEISQRKVLKENSQNFYKKLPKNSNIPTKPSWAKIFSNAQHEIGKITQKHQLSYL